MMNVSTSTTSTTASTSSTTDVNSAQSKAESSKSSEKSFEEEMKTVSNTEETKSEDVEGVKTEDTEISAKDDAKSNSAEVLTTSIQQNSDLISQEILSGMVNFNDFNTNNENQTLLSQNIQNLLDTKDLMSTVNSASTVDYDVVNMSDSDANFFANLVQNTDMSMKDIASQVTENTNVQTAKSVQVSSVLMEKLAESVKTNQPFRIDFDKDVSIIIKVNKDGSLSANFIPGDKAVEQYLRNNIASLKQRFDDENLPYSELSYSNSRDQRQQRRKKENDNE